MDHGDGEGKHQIKSDPGLETFEVRVTTPASAPEVVHDPVVTLSVLGAMSVAIGGREVRIKNRKSAALLAYVALSENFRETRERLVGIFWSESEEGKARGSLRQTLLELRASFAAAGFEGFRTDKLAVEFDRASVDVDLWAVIREAQAGRAHSLLLERQRVIEALLEGFDDLDPALRVWLLAKRETMQNRLLRALEVGLRSTQADAATRSELAQAIVNLDPTHEEACRHLMRAKSEAGDISGALRVYRSLWDLLDADYDMEPATQTQQLVADIKTGAIGPASPAAAVGVDNATASEREHPSLSPEAERWREASPRMAARIELAVEPFDMIDVEPGNVHLVAGLRQHLIACLVRFREWSVTDRPSQPSRAATGTRYAVQATAFRADEAVNLVVTLRDIGTSRYVWSDQFELRLDSWFEVQQRIVRRLTMTLNVNLSAERLMRLAGEPDVSLDIYDRWLRGQAMILSFRPDRRRTAVEIFNEIIRTAPGFSPAYSSLAQMNNIEHIVCPGVYRNRSKERQTLDLARRAVQLDPSDSRAHLCLAWSLTMAKHYDQAVGPAVVACELNENDPWTLISSATMLAYCADRERAEDLAGQALDLSPSPSPTHWAYQAIVHFLAQRYESCLAAALRAGDTMDVIPGWVVAALIHLGRRNEAIEEAGRLLARIRANWHGKSAPRDEVVAQWMLHIYPIRRREDWELLRDGLKGAGLPVGGMDHHAW